MALSLSRRLLLRFGSFSAFNGFEPPSSANQTSRTLHDFCGFSSGENLKVGTFFLACRRFSTTTLTPDSSDGAFPSDLLSKKAVITPDRDIGLCQDLVIPVTNFLSEDKRFMVLAGDVFDVPIRKDIIHRVYDGSLQNNSREHILQKQLVRLVELGESHGDKRVLVELGMEHCVVPSSGVVLLCMVLSPEVML